jgi:hypothetical protein
METAPTTEAPPKPDGVLNELLERQDKSLQSAHGHVSCVPGATWLITFRSADPTKQPVSWRLPDAKAAGRLVSALLMPDANLMLACMRDVWQGTNVVDDDYLVRLSELKRRDLVRQTRHGSRVLPTVQGEDVWRLAQEAIARDVLNKGKRAGMGRPYFVVFDAKSRGSAFKDWDRALAFAKRAVEQSPGSFAAVSGPEDIIETWRACLLSPQTLGEVDRGGIGKLEE